VHHSITTEFCASLVKVFETASKGFGADVLNPETQHGPVVDHLQFKSIMKYIELGKQSAKLLTGGERIGDKGNFIQPTIFLDPTSDSPIWTEEIFGPVLTVKTFKTEQEAVALANGTEYGLACGFSFLRAHLQTTLAWLIIPQLAFIQPILPEHCACHPSLSRVRSLLTPHICLK